MAWLAVGELYYQNMLAVGFQPLPKVLLRQSQNLFKYLKVVANFGQFVI
jgi:hypothetical protein